jgi:phosphoglucosamine mutase
MPTPGIAYLTRAFRASAGAVISASHNPYFDNGIKFFSRDGKKLPDAVEAAIEMELERPFETVDPAKLGAARRIEDAAGRYIEFCKSSVPFGLTLEGMKIVVDCAHGAGYHIAPHVFEDLGARVTAIGVAPNGTNINEGYGSTAPENLRRAVIEHGADCGVALDGDGDRLIMVDRRGEIVDGDELVYIIAGARRAAGTLKGPVVGTLMSNLGLEQALAAQGVPFLRAKVGDRHVLAMLEEHGGVIGGESSGHIICLDRTTTGDAIVSALQVLAEMLRTGKPLAELKAGMAKLPQRLVNVRMERKVDVSDPVIQAAVRAAEAELGARGRVLLRPSGTEPVIRVMVEGREPGEVERLAQQVADAVRSAANQT